MRHPHGPVVRIVDDQRWLICWDDQRSRSFSSTQRRNVGSSASFPARRRDVRSPRPREMVSRSSNDNHKRDRARRGRAPARHRTGNCGADRRALLDSYVVGLSCGRQTAAGPGWSDCVCPGDGAVRLQGSPTSSCRSGSATPDGEAAAGVDQGVRLLQVRLRGAAAVSVRG